MNWRDCKPFVDTLVAQGLVAVGEDDVELYWRIWQAGAGYGAQETWENVRSNGSPTASRAVLGVPQGVLEKARKLQALAMSESAAPQERENAWAAFSKIWKEYELPPEFGL